jgi:hypothetical protein
LAQTLRKILSPEGRILLLTDTTKVPDFEEIYSFEPLGKLRRTDVEVVHEGGLAVNYGVWASWTGGESFGK